MRHLYLNSLLSVALLFGFGQLAFSQTNPDAIKNADSFLAGLKIVEIPEGKQALLQTVWRDPTEIPVIQEQKTLYEGMFDTDIAGIQGFKRLIEMKVQSEAKTTLTVRYILISYRDRKSGAWKVFDMRNMGADSIESTIANCKKDIDDTRYTKAQFNYRRCAYWLTVGGKLQEAKQAHLTSLELNNKQPGKNFTQSEYEGSMAVLRAISGDSK